MNKRKIDDLLDGDSPIQRSLAPHGSSTQSGPQHFTLSYNSPPHRKAPIYQQPVTLLTFSYTPNRAVEFTDSALRYFVDPPLGADLSYGYERWVKRPEERGRLDGLLRAWSKVRAVQNANARNVGVIAWRGVMTKILTAVYEDKEGWDLNVMYVNGTLYLEEHLSEARLKEKETMTPRQRLQSYYGYAFESYCTSATPERRTNPSSKNPQWGGDVDTNVQWCAVVTTKLGNTRIVMGGEVDCVESKDPEKFVELKTSMQKRGPHDEARFERKLLKFYFQSFLLGVPDIVVGFRTPGGKIKSVTTFRTLEIPRAVRGKPNAWDPLICLEWGERFLEFIEKIVSRPEGHPSHVWRAKFTPHRGVTVELLSEGGVREVEGGEERRGFLPSWYWDEILLDNNQQAGVEPESRRVSGGPSMAKGLIPPGWQI